MSYHIARIIPQHKIKDKTFLYFADGSIGYIPSKVDINDFCIVIDDIEGYMQYQYVNNLENIKLVKCLNDICGDKKIFIDSNSGTSVLIDKSGRVCVNGMTNDVYLLDNIDNDYCGNSFLSPEDFSVIQEKYLLQFIHFPYREISPTLLTELLNAAEAKVSALDLDDIIDSFTITGELLRNYKSGKDNDWTIDIASMESHIKYSDSYIEHILPPQKYHDHSGSCYNNILPFFYRDDLDSYLAEKAEKMKSKARFVYSRKEHVMYNFHSLLTDVLKKNAKYEEFEKEVHNNYLEYWNNNRGNGNLCNDAYKKWMMATSLVNNKITENNIREMLFEHYKSIK